MATPITVRLLRGTTESTATASLDETVAEFASRHFAREAAAGHVRLIASGAQLEGTRTLRESGVVDGSVVHAVVNSGGASSAGAGAGASAGAGAGAGWLRSTSVGPASWFHSHPTHVLLALTAVPLLAAWSFVIRDSGMQAGAMFWILVLFTAIHFKVSAPVLARM